MRLSKLDAGKIARKMTEEKEEQVKKMALDYRQYITDRYNMQIPNEVKVFAEKYPEYLCTTRTIYFSGHGFSYEVVTSTEFVLKTNTGNAVLELDSEIADRAKKLQDKWNDAKHRLGELITSIEVTLIGLKTFKRIQEHLPEAAPFLPKKDSVELMVNFKDLRASINKKKI